MQGGDQKNIILHNSSANYRAEVTVVFIKNLFLPMNANVDTQDIDKLQPYTQSRHRHGRLR